MCASVNDHEVHPRPTQSHVRADDARHVYDGDGVLTIHGYVHVRDVP